MKHITKKYVTNLSYQIIGCAIKVHKELGPGLLESVYEKCLAYELIKKGYSVRTQVTVPINYDGLDLDANLKLDILVDDLIILELKAVEVINPVFEAQILSYMKLLKIPQGLLINFFSKNITQSTKPFVNQYFSELPDE